MKTILSAILVAIFCLHETGCSSDEMPEVITARVLQSTCRGTVMQLISASVEGQSWKYYSNIKGPFDASNPITTYENCVLVSNVPPNRDIVGDTLLFTHSLGFKPGNYCDLGGLPKPVISIETLKK